MAKLYIVRHGESPSAVDAGVATDAERPLSEKGRADIKRLAQSLAEEKIVPDIILASPLKRAQQTASTLASILNPAKGTIKFDALSGATPTPKLYKLVQQEIQKSNFSELMVVGHQPQLSDMVAVATRQAVNFKPGGIAALELVANDKARLLWFR